MATATAPTRTGSSRTSIPAGHGVKVEKSITINKPREEVYNFWRNFENLPRFMHNLESVTTTGGNRSHWVARGPMDRRVEWDAEVINERENELIAWRSLPGSAVDTAGSVHFTPAPGGRGTEVKVTLKYDPPGGKVGAAVAWMFGREPSQEISEDLRRLKRFLETGEVPTTLGQPSGRGEEQWAQTGLLVLENRAARGLGWFSIGLGLAELLAPEWLGETIGVGPDHRSWLPILGLREIASGVGILNQVRPTPWMWSRVVGDAIDLAFLGSAATEPGAKPGRLALAAAAVLGVTALDALCGLELSRDPRTASGHVPRNGNGHAARQARSRQ